jgi:hypothetical protein
MDSIILLIGPLAWVASLALMGGVAWPIDKARR